MFVFAAAYLPTSSVQCLINRNDHPDGDHVQNIGQHASSSGKFGWHLDFPRYLGKGQFSYKYDNVGSFNQANFVTKTQEILERLSEIFILIHFFPELEHKTPMSLN